MKTLQSLFVVCILCFSSLALAQTAEQEAEKLLNSIGMEDSLESSMSQMLDMQLSQNPAMVSYKGVMLEFFKKYMSYESLKPELIKLYSSTFSASELKELNAFYSSPIGRKTIEVMPTLMAKGGQVGLSRVQDNIDELQSMIKAEAERQKQSQP
ncbi:MAG: DUF2059 domain-containing protein [Parahaliea sp.]